MGQLGQAALERWSRIRRSYELGEDEAGESRPLLGYLVLMSAYAGLTAAGAAAGRRPGAPVDRPGPGDLALLAASTFRISRTLTKAAVTAPLRAPFATYQGTGGPGEVMEAPRPGKLRHAVGELVTCPLCATQWVATASFVGYLLNPRAARWVSAGMTVVAAAEAMNHVYAVLQSATAPAPPP